MSGPEPLIHPMRQAELHAFFRELLALQRKYAVRLGSDSGRLEIYDNRQIPPPSYPYAAVIVSDHRSLQTLLIAQWAEPGELAAITPEVV